MASDSPGTYSRMHHINDSHDCHIIGDFLSDSNATRGSLHMGVAASLQRDSSYTVKDSGYYVSTSDGASTCSSSTTEPGEIEGGTLLVLEPKSLRSFTTNDEYLYAMKEDLADWFACLYQNDEISAENFFHFLETGVLLCKHANKVQEFARQRREVGESLEMRSYFIRSVPEGNVPFREGVKPETFQARDNVSNFISWGRLLGIPEVLSFETDDLVLRKNEKSVILCLLEIARIGAKLGMIAPTLIQMEQEIDAELAGEEPQPHVQIKTCDMRSLDERVRDLIGRCTCPVQFPMIKVGEGKYKIGDSRTLIFVRILRNHVMVRVGGGWDTLENYLNKHDPCQCNYRGHRPSVGGVAHKVAVSQPRQPAATPANPASRPTPNTPTSPRRSSTTAAADAAAAAKNRSSSPHSASNTKTPALVISRHTSGVAAPKTGTVSNHTSKPGAGPTPGQTQQGHEPWVRPSSAGASSNSARCSSPSPSRRRSPPARSIPQLSNHPQTAHGTSSSSALIRKEEDTRESKIATLRKELAESIDRPMFYEGQTDLVQDLSDMEQKSLQHFVADKGEIINMDKISTMTLAEFKSLLNSNLSVPEEQRSQENDLWGERSPEHHRSAGSTNSRSQNCNSSAPNDTARRAANSDIPRPKTPTFIARPKTPKAYNDNEKATPKEEYRMARPKTPSQIRNEAVSKVAGAISGKGDFRNEAGSAVTPTSRSKTPTRPQTLAAPFSTMSQKSFHENVEIDHVEFTDLCASSIMLTPGSLARDRPATPSRIPKPCFIPRPTTPKTQSSLPGDHSRDVTSPIGFPSEPHSTTTRLNSRPSALSRSNSNSSSVKSVEDAPASPSSSFSEERAFRGHTRSRKLSTSSDLFNSNTSNYSGNSNNNNTSRGYKDIHSAKRASGPEGRNPVIRAVTPGPREKWTIGGGNSSGSHPTNATISGQRRGSINTTSHVDRQIFQKLNTSSQIRRTSSASNIDTDQHMAITNEITFSDDEEINELMKQVALKAKAKNNRSSSMDARKILQKKSKENEEVVLMIRRDGHQSAPHKAGDKVEPGSKFSIVRRPSSRNSSTDRASPTAMVSRFGSQIPHFAASQVKGSTAVKGQGSDVPHSSTPNRTEAWVDSTLPDNKRKPQSRPKRSRDSGNDIPASELVSRPLEEIQAILSESKNGYFHVDSKTLDPPAEDPEMFRKMEKLFEKYKQMELSASITETQGGAKTMSRDKSSDTRSAKSENQATASKLSMSVTSLKISNKSSIPYPARSPGWSSSMVSSNVENKFTKSPSLQGTFQNQPPRSSSNCHFPSPSRDGSVTMETNCQQETLHRDVSTVEYTDSDLKRLEALQDIDSELASNPAALIFKIKEILKVRPRKDENSKGITRIPAPANLKYKRSKSVTSLYSDGPPGHEFNIDQSEKTETHNTSNLIPADQMIYNSRSFENSTSLWSEGVPFDTLQQRINEAPELTQSYPVQSDSSQNRAETPAPKLATPLTTGRSTLISRRGDRFQREGSLEKEPNSQHTASNWTSPAVEEEEVQFV